MRLWDRVWKVEVEGDGGKLVDVSELDIAFKIQKSTKAEPNTCDLVIANLAADTRGRILAVRHPQIRVWAGYRETGLALLFVGDTREIDISREASEVLMTITAADRGRSYQTARIARSFPAGTSCQVVLESVVDALGIGRGNLADVVQSFTLSNGARTFSEGFVASGPAHRVLDGLLRGGQVDGRGAGLRWSVQNGVLVISRRGQPVQTRATVLSPSSGLLGSPTAGDRGEVTAKSLIQPGLDPGRVVKLESTDYDGGYVVRAAAISGDTQGDAWDVELVLRPY
jgi:hypothetical protein